MLSTKSNEPQPHLGIFENKHCNISFFNVSAHFLIYSEQYIYILKSGHVYT